MQYVVDALDLDIHADVASLPVAVHHHNVTVPGVIRFAQLCAQELSDNLRIFAQAGNTFWKFVRASELLLQYLLNELSATVRPKWYAHILNRPVHLKKPYCVSGVVHPTNSRACQVVLYAHLEDDVVACYAHRVNIKDNPILSF